MSKIDRLKQYVRPDVQVNRPTGISHRLFSKIQAEGDRSYGVTIILITNFEKLLNEDPKYEKRNDILNMDGMLEEIDKPEVLYIDLPF
jgi:hypothetical protein